MRAQVNVQKTGRVISRRVVKAAQSVDVARTKEERSKAWTLRIKGEKPHKRTSAQGTQRLRTALSIDPSQLRTPPTRLLTDLPYPKGTGSPYT